MPRKKYGTKYFPDYNNPAVKYCGITNDLELYSGFHFSRTLMSLDGIKDKEVALEQAKTIENLSQSQREVVEQAINYLYQ